MFLDDKLYNHVKLRELKDSDDFIVLINELYRICEDHYKPQLTPGMSYHQGKIILDRTFNAWDLFITKLEKDEWFLIDILKTCSFKDTYFKNDRLKEIYNTGK